MLACFKERLDALSNVQDYVRLWRGERDKIGFHCMRVDTKIDGFSGGAHSTSSRCGDYKSCKKCEQKCEHQPWNSDAVDVNLKLRAARHDRNWAIINLFFVTRKGAQLLKYTSLKRRGAKLLKDYETSLDKVARIKNALDVEICLGEDGPNDIDLPGLERASPEYKKVVEGMQQKKIAYDLTVAQMNVARNELFGWTK